MVHIPNYTEIGRKSFLLTCNQSLGNSSGVFQACFVLHNISRKLNKLDPKILEQDDDQPNNANATSATGGNALHSSIIRTTFGGP